MCHSDLLSAVSFYWRRIRVDYYLRIYSGVLTGLLCRLCNIRRCVLLFCARCRSILSHIRLSSTVSLVLNPIHTWRWDICNVHDRWLGRLWWIRCRNLYTGCVLCHWYLHSWVSLISRSICAVFYWLTRCRILNLWWRLLRNICCLIQLLRTIICKVLSHGYFDSAIISNCFIWIWCRNLIHCWVQTRLRFSLWAIQCGILLNYTTVCCVFGENYLRRAVSCILGDSYLRRTVSCILGDSCLRRTVSCVLCDSCLRRTVSCIFDDSCLRRTVSCILGDSCLRRTVSCILGDSCLRRAVSCVFGCIVLNCYLLI